MTRRSNSPAPSCADPRAVIVVARAARQLAAAARAAGWQPLVADAHGDEDTRALASGWQALPLGPSHEIRARGVLQAVAHLRTQAPSAPLVWGSGFESHATLLAQLSRRGPMLGAPPSALQVLRDPHAWTRLLERLAIAHPRVAVGRVPRQGAWLAKRAGQSGGAHVRFAAAGTALGAREYAQRLVPGRALSVVFVAGGHDLRLAGCCEQLFSPTPESPFRHAGSVALTPDALSRSLRRELQRAVECLVDALALRGLCGIDFVLQPDGAWQLIELNARPPSSFDLHVAAGAMFRAHLAACLGQRLPVLRPLALRRAQAVHYAPSALRIPNSIDWPAWVADRPHRGSSVPAGAPVCTVRASGATPAVALRRLHARLDRLRGWLGDAARRLPRTSLEILAGEHLHE